MLAVKAYISTPQVLISLHPCARPCRESMSGARASLFERTCGHFFSLRGAPVRIQANGRSLRTGARK